MRIAEIATVASPVREHGAESVEGLIWLLTRELSRLGHEVTVFGIVGSEVSGEVVTTLPGSYGDPGCPDEWHLCEWINLCRAIEQSGQFDVLHSHAYLWSLPLESLSLAPMVHTMHVTPYEDQARLWNLYPNACVTAISHYQWARYPELRPIETIYHGVDPSQFTSQLEPEDYLCYLGRFIPDKGPLQAIAAAKEIGIRLLLAGPRNDYYEERIAPLVDGKSVEYVGYVAGREKDRLLRGARALLYPVQDPEPFGLVLIESMMCGTPVAAISLGAVPEIVEEGITGHCAVGDEDFAGALLKSLVLDRRIVRQRAEIRFSAERMATEYASVYQRVALGETLLSEIS